MKNKRLLGAMSLKERYEKRLWALILEDSGGTPTGSTEPTPEQIEESIQKLAKKIENAGIESLKEPINSLNQQFQKLKSPESDSGSEIKSDLQQFNSVMKNSVEEVLNSIWQKISEEEQDDIFSLYRQLIDSGKKYFSDSSQEEKKSSKIEFQSSIENFIQKIKTIIGNISDPNDQKALENLIKNDSPFVVFFEEKFKENDNMPSMEEMLSVVDTLDKKITTVVKAYGEWIKDNKENISQVMAAIEEEKAGTKATQTSGYRRLGNTLFERFLKSGGLR